MLKIFILIFTAGLVLYIASAILVKIDENRRFKKAKKFNSDKIIDRYMEENKRFSKNCKPFQYVFVICEIIADCSQRLKSWGSQNLMENNIHLDMFRLRTNLRN